MPPFVRLKDYHQGKGMTVGIRGTEYQMRSVTLRDRFSRDEASCLGQAE